MDGELSFLTLHEIVRAAYDRTDRGIWDYITGGTETETTVRRNRLAIDRLAFRPRVLRDVSRIDHSGRFFGRETRLPVALAPVGGLESIGPTGEILVAQAASRFGIPFYLSSVTKVGMEEVAAAAPDGPKVFQLYVRGDEGFIDDHIRRAIDSGYDAFCLTSTRRSIPGASATSRGASSSLGVTGQAARSSRRRSRGGTSSGSRRSTTSG